MLLNACREETYILVKNLCAPISPEKRQFGELTELLSKHFTPIRSYFAARLKFYNTRKTATESVANWGARVRNLASVCGFGTEIDILMRDVFVTGLGQGKILDRLLEENATDAALTFSKVHDMALAREAALHEYSTAAAGTSVSVAGIKT